jgi:hypothetical protein
MGNKLKLEVGVPVETKGDFFVEFWIFKSNFLTFKTFIYILYK